MKTTEQIEQEARKLKAQIHKLVVKFINEVGPCDVTIETKQTILELEGCNHNVPIETTTSIAVTVWV
jgi:hypothetical protein